MKLIMSILGLFLMLGNMDAQADNCPKFDAPNASLNAQNSQDFFTMLNSSPVQEVSEDVLDTRTHKVSPKTEAKLSKQPLPHRKVIGGILKYDANKSTQKGKCCYQYASRKRDIASKAAPVCGTNRVCFCASEIVIKKAEEKKTTPQPSSDAEIMAQMHSTLDELERLENQLKDIEEKHLR